jgi:hypothetical protein
MGDENLHWNQYSATVHPKAMLQRYTSNIAASYRTVPPPSDTCKNCKLKPPLSPPLFPLCLYESECDDRRTPL